MLDIQNPKDKLFSSGPSQKQGPNAPPTYEEFITYFRYGKIPGRPLYNNLGSQTIGTLQIAVPHKLSKTPNVVLIQMTSPGNVYESQAADATNIYLTSDHYLSRTCNVLVAYIENNLR